MAFRRTPFVNDAGPSGEFVSGGNSFNNGNDGFGDWYGWAISSTTDTTTPGFTNQYSAITGTGANGSPDYAVAYTFGPTADPFAPASSFINLAPGTTPVSADVTNTTYAYLSMLSGDSFAKQFGAGDFFLLDVTGWSGLNGTGTEIGDVPFYLANFLGGNSYIVDTWQNVNLTSLAGAESLQFGLSSSDNDPIYGMNTPAYFALDDLEVNSLPEPNGFVLLSMTAIVGLSFTIARKQRNGSPLIGHPS